MIQKASENEYAAIQHLLRDLPLLYPDGREWLNQKLYEDGVIVLVESEIRGVLIMSPRDSACKINTIFVHPDHRREGIGKALVEESSKMWSKKVYLTVAEESLEAIEGLLSPWGFKKVGCKTGLYRPHKREFVLANQTLS